LLKKQVGTFPRSGSFPMSGGMAMTDDKTKRGSIKALRRVRPGD